MKNLKIFLLFSFPIFLLYLLNIILFNEYPDFFSCFCGSATYIYNLIKINSSKKVIFNFLDKEKNKLSTQDFMNLVLIFIITFLFTILIWIIEKKISGKNHEISFAFWGASLIFEIMSRLKIPKFFFETI